MAEVNQGFEAAMRRGREFGAAANWSKALTEYIRAAQLIPTDIAARYGLAMALFKIGQLDQAQQQFQGIVRIQPQNTDAWQRLAELYHQAGRTPQALQTYQHIKELHQKNGRTREVGEILREIIRINPGQAPAYRELMDRAKARGDRKTAASLVLDLGRYYQSQGKLKDGLSCANEALILMPDWPEAENLKDELSQAVAPVALDELTPGPEAVQEASDEADDEAAQAAAAREATIQQLITFAEEALARGDTGPALRNFEMAVETGSDRADIFYSIGKLYADQGQTDRAVNYLRRSTSDPDYAVSAFFSMGQAYAAADRLPESASAFWEALNRIDLQTIGKDDVDDLIDMYDELGEVLLRQSKDKEAADLYTRLVNFINSRNFRTDKTALTIIRARELNEKLAPPPDMAPSLNEKEDPTPTSSIRFGADSPDEPTEDGQGSSEALISPTQLPPVGSFANPGGPGRVVSATLTAPAIPAVFPSHLIEMDPSPAAGPYLRAAEEFMRQHKYYAAVDASQEIIRYYPHYLPAQIILAEIFVAQERLEQARTKYQFVVDVYQVRQDPLKSLEVYKRLGTLSADNIALRTKLANLLLQYNQQEEAADVLLTTISSYVSSGQLERALEECRRLRSLAPQSVPIRLQYAELLNQMERYTEAMPELQQALELAPNNLKALCLLNITAFLSDNANLRWKTFQTLVERSRQGAENLKLALENYLQAASLYGQPALYYGLGCLYLENKQFSQAERAFEQALSGLETGSDPGQALYAPLLHWELGQLYLETRPQEALDQFEKAAHLAEQADPAVYAPHEAAYGELPTSVSLQRKLAQTYQLQGQTEQAIQAFRQVKKLIPFNRAVHTELADLYFNQGQLNEALGELAELVSHFEETGQVEASIEVLREMVGLAPNNIMVRDKLSQVYLKRGMIEEGLKELDELAELQRKNGRLKDAVRTLQRAAEVYWMMGKMEPAYELYDRIVRISPGDVEARQQLVNRHLMAGNVKDAIEEQRAIAQICLQSNNTQEAIAALHQVIGLAPEDSRAYFQLASVLSSVNEHGQAYRLYQRILRLEPDNQKAKSLLEQAQKKAMEAGQLKLEPT
jgi:tetratricopeptide (TPR) repeat protein